MSASRSDEGEQAVAEREQAIDLWISRQSVRICASGVRTAELLLSDSKA